MSDQGNEVEVSYVPDDSGDNDAAEVHESPELEEQKKEQKEKKTTPRKRTSTKKLQEKLKEQKEILEQVAAERDEFKDKYLRNLAEIDNFRKRIKKEKEDYQKYILSDFLLNLLEVFDNLERALSARKPEEGETSIISGVEMIHKQLQDLLKKYEVKEVDALNKPFDPNFHQALSRVEQDDIEEPLVVEVYQKGFLYNGKLLRPALAKVAVPVEPETKEEASEEVEDN